MGALLADYDTLTARIDAAHVLMEDKVKELNELTAELIDMLPPTIEEIRAFNAQNEATMEPYVAVLDELVDRREALAQRIYDYEVARRRFLNQPPLDSEAKRA